MRVLVLDNYDSFTYNLVHLLEQFPIDPVVVRNDRVDLERVGDYDRVLLSPGPGLPNEAGLMPQLLERYAGTVNILGVCLGLQGIVEHFGGQLSNLERVAHGIATRVSISQPNDSLFAGFPPSFQAGRYHSWVAEPKMMPEQLEVTARDEKGTVMAIRHLELPIRGVQFHPESIMTEHGLLLMENWLGIPPA